MEANVENLVKAMKLCAEAHHCTCIHDDDFEQIALITQSVPLHADISTIAKAFLQDTDGIVVLENGYTSLYYAEDNFLDEVDTETLAMGLPTGWLDRIVDESKKKLYIVTTINKSGDGEIHSDSDLCKTLEEAQEKVRKWFKEEMKDRDSEGEELTEKDQHHYYWERSFDNEELHYTITEVKNPL